jgi:hypothetical protein
MPPHLTDGYLCKLYLSGLNREADEAEGTGPLRGAEDMGPEEKEMRENLKV